MKIGINLVGVSHLDDKESQKDHLGKSGRKRNYEDHPPNIIQNIIEPLKINHDVKVYLTTYEHSRMQELLDMYKPQKYQIIDFASSYMQKTYAQSIEFLISEDIDFIISTRFDIVFLKTINEMIMDPTKFNVLYKEKDHDAYNYTSDILFAFPKSMISEFVQAIHRCFSNRDKNGLHAVAYELSTKIGMENINFIDAEPQLGAIHQNKYFYLPKWAHGIL